jgi:hypothetical protein
MYIKPSGAAKKSINELLDEFAINRNNSISLINSLSEDNLNFIGIASGKNMSARAFAFSTIGHDIWHTNIIKERYL